VSLDSVSLINYRRISTTIELTGERAYGMKRRVITVDQFELEEAQKRDKVAS
jgi:hypothetical protein